ncbi:hypothetical protein C8Q74DRAFT_1214309 [Fomes fomentarius]|nr:hypothetical protein C8Q74DRAFT_1214309 [Fomes fomentarius]
MNEIPPTHKVLLCDELLRAIFRQMSTGMVHPDDKPEDVQERIELRRTLAHAARVCQAFSEPALNALWCALDNLVPLLRLLPGFQRRDSTYDKFQFLTNGVTDEGWSRLQHHASRVRGLCHYPGTSIHTTVWLAVMARSQGMTLLPRLRVLDVDHIPVADIALLLVLLSPSLLELYLSFRNDVDPNDPVSGSSPVLSSVSGMLLESIAAVASDLTIFYMDEHFPAPSQNLKALSRLTKLRELKLCDPATTVTAPALRAISALSSLRTLSIEDLCLFGASLELEDGISSLETLYVHARPDDLSRLVHGSRFATLKHFDVLIHCEDGALPTDQLSSIFSHLPQTVHNIRMGFCDGAVAPRSTLADLLMLMQPLKELLDLTIDAGAGKLTLGDTDMKVLADQWPRIRKFILADDKEQPRPISDPQPTFAALIDVARRCPALETLALPCLDTASLPPLEEIPLLRHSLHWLEFARYVGTSTPAEVAEAVDRLFPTIELEYNPDVTPASQEGAKAWHPVWDYLKTKRDGDERIDQAIAQIAVLSV